MSRKTVLSRRLPARFGSLPLFVSPGAALKFWSADLEKADPGLMRICEEVVGPGMVVWDVGANVGLFSFAAAHLAGPTGRVLAVEPDTFLVDLLRRSARCGARRAKVDVLPVAVSDRLGISEFCIAERGRASNHLGSTPGSTQAGGVREVHAVMTVTLDWLLDHYPAPAVLKIDVECAEGEVLRGGSRLLREFRPQVICEVSPEGADAVTACLKRGGYRFYDADVAPQQRVPLERPAWNTLACPS